MLHQVQRHLKAAGVGFRAPICRIQRRRASWPPQAPVPPEDGQGSLSALIHAPVKGTQPYSAHMLSQFYSRQNTDSHAHAKTGSYSKLPKLNFPVFDGGTPKLWISRCEDYFDLYDVSPADWIKVTSMHFVDPAARWLQSPSRKVKMCS
jgi:hypothetical protein